MKTEQRTFTASLRMWKGTAYVINKTPKHLLVACDTLHIGHQRMKTSPKIHLAPSKQAFIVSAGILEEGDEGMILDRFFDQCFDAPGAFEQRFLDFQDLFSTHCLEWGNQLYADFSSDHLDVFLRLYIAETFIIGADEGKFFIRGYRFYPILSSNREISFQFSQTNLDNHPDDIPIFGGTTNAAKKEYEFLKDKWDTLPPAGKLFDVIRAQERATPTMVGGPITIGQVDLDGRTYQWDTEGEPLLIPDGWVAKEKAPIEAPPNEIPSDFPEQDD